MKSDKMLNLKNQKFYLKLDDLKQLMDNIFYESFYNYLLRKKNSYVNKNNEVVIDYKVVKNNVLRDYLMRYIKNYTHPMSISMLMYGFCISIYYDPYNYNEIIFDENPMQHFLIMLSNMMEINYSQLKVDYYKIIDSLNYINQFDYHTTRRIIKELLTNPFYFRKYHKYLQSDKFKMFIKYNYNIKMKK